MKIFRGGAVQHCSPETKLIFAKQEENSLHDKLLRDHGAGGLGFMALPHGATAIPPC